MRQRWTKVEGEKDQKRAYDDIRRKKRLIELVALPFSLFPPTAISLMHVQHVLGQDRYMVVDIIGLWWVFSDLSHGQKNVDTQWSKDEPQCSYQS